MAENVSAPSCRALFLSVLLLGMLMPRVMMGQANVQGQWSTLPNLVPINPIHVALLPNGKVLIVAGSGNCPPSQSGCPAGAPYGPSNSSGAVLYDPPGTFTPFTVTWDMFCNGMVLLPDGRAFIDGGTIQNGYDPFRGSSKTSIFNHATNTFTDAQNMADGRWYPTVTTLGDGRLMTFSGLDLNGSTNTAVEIYTVGSGWSQEYFAGWTPPLYPWMHLLPNGKVFYSGPGASSALFDPSTPTWTLNVATTQYGGFRLYGSSVLLPLTPANNYRPKVMILGGDNPATATTEIIDLGAATPTWQFGPNMSQPRIELNAVILPNGKVLAMGGSRFDEDPGTLSLNADLYNPATNTFSSGGANAFGRLYHSVALLLPDATVWLAGGNPVRGQYEQRMEIYKPAYLFQANGTAAIRPSISSAPNSIPWGSPFTVQTPDAASIASVVLVRNGATTHAFDMDQRLVEMSFTRGSGLTVTAPPNGNIAPPGYYMLFILNNLGVPSVARFVQLTQGAQSPDFSLSATPPSRSVAPGGSTTYAVTVTPSGGFNGTVSFSASGLPAGAAASFSGSGPTTMTVTTATSTPLGSYTLTITGTSGSLIRTTTVTLTVGTNLALGKPAVASSVYGASYPASAAVDGNLTTRWSSTFSDPQWIYVDLGATYNVNRVKLVWEAAYGKSFQIQVSTDATNWTDIFSTTTNSVLTNDLTGLTGTGRYVRMNGRLRGTPYGYSLYEIEVYGSQAAQSPDFSLSATPPSRSVAPGGSTTYAVTVTPSGGFNGTVSFSASGLPTGAAASFSPTTVSGSGSTTMTVTTASSTPVGSSPVTITGTSGGLSRQTGVTLTVTSGGATGSLSGSLATPSGTQNLTSLGTVDWAHWGLTTAGSFNHKAGVTQQISNFTIVGTGPANRFTSNAFGYSWTDGTPTGSATNSTTGIYILGVGNGFKITAPADTTQRTLKVYVSAFNARGQMVAHLSDASSPDYVNSTLNGVNSSARGVYTFTYKAASSGQTLSVTFTDITSNGGSSNVTLQAATMP